ncbi:hypothetical protein N658DRAFT_519802 [Parathielavia hyrcaniae]|uniref:Uncharacterized protein n=1 Tax=Parathielavia hyrcaniae TaxID=113614 RepID=A0AAN6Q9Q9_9PEZI|nr:hypothetical protein N658DRAFT_519802 [Parathielavia hyrcaniae]
MAENYHYEYPDPCPGEGPGELYEPEPDLASLFGESFMDESFMDEPFMEAYHNMNDLHDLQPGNSGDPTSGDNTTASASASPQVTADPVVRDSGLTFPAPPVPQHLIDPALRDPSPAVSATSAPEAYQGPVESGGCDSQTHANQNIHDQALTGQDAYNSTHGHSAYAMPPPPPPPPPPNNVPSTTHHGMQSEFAQQPQLPQFTPQQLQLLQQMLQEQQSQSKQQPPQPQFTQAMQSQTGQLFTPGISLQSVGLHAPASINYTQPGQPLHHLNQPVQPNPPVPVWQQAQPSQPMLQHNRRRKGSPSNDPNCRYANPSGLSDWDPQEGKDKGDRLFRYYLHSAELKPGVTYTREQLVDFFLGTENPNPHRHLTLWIQNTPAQSNDRYAAGGNSAKCRFEGCPGRQHTIMKGFLRVAFDEFSDRTGKFDGVDPMRNAGYMHLHCFETAFDLGYLIHHGAARACFRIAADTRQLEAETKNPMSITRDHSEMLEAYNQWVDGQRARADEIEARNAELPREQRYTGFAPATDEIPPHKYRLGYALTVKHLVTESGARAKHREQRGGAHIGLHVGDLILYEQLKRQIAEHQRRQASQRPEAEAEGTGVPQIKMKRRSGSDDDDDDTAVPAPKRSRFARPQPSHGRMKAEPEGDSTVVADTIVVGGGSPPWPQSDSPPRNPPSRRFKPACGTSRRSRPGPVRLIVPGGDGDGDLAQQQQQQAAAYQIIGQLSAQPRVTRQTTMKIQSRLGGEPAVVRDRVLRGVSPAYQPLFDGSVRHERLAKRISRFGPAQRRAVEDTVGRQEREERVLGGKRRGVLSM